MIHSDRHRTEPLILFPTKSTHQQLWAVIVIYLMLGIGYGIALPLFEAPDEHSHYFTAQWIADNGRLPSVPQPAVEHTFIPETEADWLGQEAAQPPLYYLLAAGVVAVFDTGSAYTDTHYNPFVRLGDAAADANRNAFLHGPAEAWPWRGHTLAAHTLRIISTLIGAGTIWLVFAGARILWPAQPQRAITAAALLGFLPQFGFQHAAVSNDVLITLLVTAVLVALLYTDRFQVENLFAYLGIGILVGLAALTKNQGIVIMAYAVGFIGWRGIARNQLKTAITRAAAVLVVGVLMASWLWLRNWQLYGDLTAANQFVILAGGDRGFTLGQVLGESSGLWLSLFATFGWFSVLPPPFVHYIWSALAILAAVGAIWGGYRSGTIRIAGRDWPDLIWRPSFLLFGWLALVYASLVAFMLQTPAAQGRLLFPAVLPMVLGLTYGLDILFQKLKMARWLTLATLLSISAYCILFVIYPAYARPSIVTAVPESATTVQADLGQGIQLLAVEPFPNEITAGDHIPLTLYWRQSAVVQPERQSLVIELFGTDLELVGKWQGYHHHGLYPIDFWSADQILKTTEWVEVELPEQMPVAAQIVLKLEDQTESANLGRLKILSPPTPPPAAMTAGPQPLAVLDTCIAVHSIDVAAQTAKPGDIIPVTITWRPQCAPNRDYTTFLHLGPTDQPPVAQIDSQPRNGQYPTRFWGVEDGTFTDQYHLILPADLPTGLYQLRFGMYQSDSPIFERAPLVVDDERQPNDQFIVGQIEVQGNNE